MVGLDVDLTARTTPELVERVCRVVRHRGATLVRLEATARPDEQPGGALAAPAGTTVISLSLDVPGDPDLMVRQLSRLPDVVAARRLTAP